MGLKVLSDLIIGNLRFPSSDGSNGQVLRTDGNGNLVFATVSTVDTKLNALSFNIGSGVLTTTLSDNNTVTVNLDGRYAAANHVHEYDNYQSWNLKTNGIQRTTVQSGGTLDLVAGSNVALSYGAGGVVTISSTITNNNQLTNGADYITTNASITGNAGTATTLQTARTINGTSFNGSANITTANWGTARTLTIGNTGKSVNGSGNVSWSLAEIGAAAASHTHTIANVTGLQVALNGKAASSHTHTIANVTGLQTALDSKINTTYSAGSGLTLSGTTFSVQNDLRGKVSLIGPNTADYINVTDTYIDFVLDSAVDMRLYNDGTLHVEGDVIAYSTTISDERLKDDVTTIQNPLDKIKALRGVEYTWNAGSRNGKRDLGLIAQEVEKVIPEIVHDHELPLIDGESGTVYKTVDYEKMIAVLIEGMKEQQVEIENLRSEVEKLKLK